MDLATLGFRADTRDLSRAGNSLDGLARTGDRTERRIGRSMQGVERSFEGVSNASRQFLSLSNAIGLVAGALAALQVGGLVRDLVKYTDTWTLLNSQLKQVTDSESDLLKVRSQLLGVTRDTRSDLAGTVNLYAEMSRSTADLGVSSGRLIGITKTINNLFLAGGKAASETAGAIRQLNQGFASGVLRGDEFNSVAEGAPRIMDALSESLKMSRGELRAFAAVGGITAGIMVSALEDYKSKAQELADTTTATFDQMMTLSRTNAIEFVGMSESIGSAVNSLGESILFFSENLDALSKAGIGFISVVGVGLVVAIGKATVATVTQIAADATAINMARSAAVTRAALAVSYATSAATIAASEVVASEARVASTGFVIAQMVAELELEKVRFAAQISQTGRTQALTRMAEIQVALTATTRQLAADEAKLAVASGVATNSLRAQVVATGALTRSEVAATAATTALGTAIRFMMGPWGLLVTAVGIAATAFITTSSNSKDLRLELEKQDETITKLKESYSAMSRESVSSSLLAATKKQFEIEGKRLTLSRELEKLTPKKIPATYGYGQVQEPKPFTYGGKDNENVKSVELIRQAIKYLDADSVVASNQMTVLKGVLESFKASDIEAARKETARLAIEAQRAKKAQEDYLKSIMNFQTPIEKLQSKISEFYSLLSGGDISPTSGAAGYIKSLEEQLKQLNEAAKDTSYQDWIDGLISDSTKGQLAELEAEIKRIQAAMTGGLDADVGNEAIDKLNEQINDIKAIDSPMASWSDDIGNFTNGIGSGLSAIQGMAKRGSKEYKALGVAMAANNVIAAVGAVLEQGKGDPYTAFGRMAAMAASVAALGVSIGGLSGGFEDESKAAQDAQGLNIWGDKSESISNSIDMTASATEKLVGINTGMLNALKSVERGISGASSLVGRDISTPQVDIGSLGMYDTAGVGEDIGMVIGTLIPVVGTYIGGAIGKLIGGMFGGKSKVVNEGIRIVGGTIGDLIEDVTLQGFQTVKYKKWRFGSSKHKTVFENIGGQAADQVSLVFGSIADSIFIGATALGLASADVEKAINDYNIATIDISLKGLSADAKQKELEAVFSRVFDGLASSVISFLPSFQKVGEGLGETLARVATQVQIADLMTERFGLTFGDKMANPELYARAADNITSLVGGVEELAEATSTFTKAFASDAQQLSIQQRELLRSFQAVGLELPSTSQGMWDLMQSLDGSTEQGQEQIATLLRLSGASESYIGLLDKVSKRYTNAIEAMFKSSDAVKQIGLDAALAAAKMGDMSLAEALDLGALNPNQSDFGTFADFAFAQAVTANKIQELADLSRGTVSEGQQQIDLLAKIADNTVKEPTASQTAIKVDTAELNAEIKMLRVENAEMARAQAKLTENMEYTMRRLLTIEQNKEVAQ